MSCRRARFAFVSLRPVVLDLGVQVLTLLLHFRAFFVPANQIRTEQIEFVIQSDEPTYQFVLHLAVHRFIILSCPSRGALSDDRPYPRPLSKGIQQSARLEEYHRRDGLWGK